MGVAVTIGLPFYNAEHTLGAALRSVFAQTCLDWRLVLVDDGSTDGSLDIARRVRDSRVSVISDGVNKGLPTRLNEIAAIAQTPYLARMDADDLMHPERLECQLRALEASPDIDVVGTAAYITGSDGLVMGVRGLGPLPVGQAAVLRQHGLLMHVTVVGRTKWFQRNPYDAAFPRAEDFELWVRTASASSFAKVERPLFFVGEGGSFTVAKYRSSCRTDRRVIRKYGPAAVGWPRTGLLLLGSLAKEAAHWLLAGVGTQRVILGRRNAPATPEQLRDAQRALEVIRGTVVPGLKQTLDERGRYAEGEVAQPAGQQAVGEQCK